MYSVEAYIKDKGGALASDIIRHFEGMGHNAPAVRQRLSRAKGKVKRLETLTFPHGAKFYYHEDSWGGDKYWHSLIDACRKSGSVYAPALDGISAKGGTIPQSLFPIISGSPVKQKKHIGSEAILERLLQTKFLEYYDDPEYGRCVFLSPYLNSRILTKELRAYQIVEHTLLLAIKDWCRKLGFASFDKIQIRNPTITEQPKFGTTCWDMVGVSYLHPLTERHNGKIRPGSIVCDVFVDNIQSKHNIEYFIRKLRALSSVKNFAPVLPIIVANSFHKDAFNKLRSLGIVATTPDSLFGTHTAEAFRSLLNTLQNAAIVATKQPDVIHDLFSRFGQIEGAAQNLRGDLFEMIVAHLVHHREGYQIDIGERVIDYDTGERKEIDVRGFKGKETVWHCECKAHQPTEIVNVDMVDDWLTQNVPVIYKATLKNRSDLSGRRFQFEYWTCGEFDNEATQFLEQKKSEIKKYDINWKDGKAVREYAAQAKVKSLCETLDEHYFNHPIAKF